MELMTAREYAATRNIPLATVRSYCREGVVPYLQRGKPYLVDPVLADEAIAQLMCKNMTFRSNGMRRSNRKKKFDFEAALAAL